MSEGYYRGQSRKRAEPAGGGVCQEPPWVEKLVRRLVSRPRRCWTDHPPSALKSDPRRILLKLHRTFGPPATINRCRCDLVLSQSAGRRSDVTGADRLPFGRRYCGRSRAFADQNPTSVKRGISRPPRSEGREQVEKVLVVDPTVDFLQRRRRFDRTAGTPAAKPPFALSAAVSSPSRSFRATGPVDAGPLLCGRLSGSFSGNPKRSRRR